MIQKNNILKFTIIIIFQKNLTYSDIVQSLQVLNLIADVTKAVLSENVDITWDCLAKLKKFFRVSFIYLKNKFIY